MELQKHTKGQGENDCIYPMTQDGLDNMQDCRLVNPKVGKHYGLKIPCDFDIEAAAREILEVRLMVQKGVYPIDFLNKYYPYKEEFGELSNIIPQPLRIEGLSAMRPQELANIVHMDNPMDMPLAVLKWLVDPMYQQSINVNAWVPNHINFLETIPNVNEDIADGIKRMLNKCFEAKYYFGLARPEEVTGLNENLTAYQEGCPNHPSLPQGHGAAAAGGVSEIIRHFSDNLTNAQLKVLLDCVYLWGQFRCLAGVHYGIDVIASLAMSPLRKYMSDKWLDNISNA